MDHRLPVIARPAENSGDRDGMTVPTATHARAIRSVRMKRLKPVPRPVRTGCAVECVPRCDNQTAQGGE